MSADEEKDKNGDEKANKKTREEITNMFLRLVPLPPESAVNLEDLRLTQLLLAEKGGKCFKM